MSAMLIFVYAVMILSVIAVVVFIVHKEINDMRYLSEIMKLREENNALKNQVKNA